MHKKQFEDDTTMFFWDSPAEMATEADRKLSPFNKAEHDNRSWTGESWADAVRKAVNGDTAHVSEAEKFLEDVLFQIDVPRAEWQNSFAGAFPMVPAAVAGHPENMRRRVEVTHDRTPLRIFVDATSSGGIDPDDLVKRGIVYVALAVAMGAVRPVELYLVNALGGRRTGVNVIRLGQSPIDLSMVCNAMTSVALTRSLGYAWCGEMAGTGGHWAWEIYPMDKGRGSYSEKMRRALGCTEHDLFVPPFFLHDEAVKDPVAFLKRTVEEFSKDREGV